MIFSFCIQIFAQGLVNLNRAIQDDIVAIEILPESQWAAPSSLVLQEKDEELAEEEQEKNVNAHYFNVLRLLIALGLYNLIVKKKKDRSKNIFDVFYNASTLIKHWYIYFKCFILN